MPRARIQTAFAGRRSEVENDIRQPRQSPQAGRLVEVGDDGFCSRLAPWRGRRRISQQGIDLGSPGNKGKNAASDISAADHENFLHAGIVAEHKGKR